MTAVVLRGDAAHLPLPDGSVDLIACSPPYFGQRDYRDGGESLEGQIGSEATPQEYIAALLRCTREWMRVLKPGGSIFVNLGDKYSQRVATRPSSHQDGLFPGRPELRKDWKRDRAAGLARMPYQNVIDSDGNYVREKSLMGLPWRYALGCVDTLGLILRAEIVWDKPTGLPESVTDRVRRSHEQVFHFTRQPRYFSAIDEIREEYDGFRPAGVGNGSRKIAAARQSVNVDYGGERPEQNPLGKLPGSVWEIPPVPLIMPDWLGVDHFAAYPPELCRRIILGWSPSGICTECGEGRRPDGHTERTFDGEPIGPGEGGIFGGMKRLSRNKGVGNWRFGSRTTITGYTCACSDATAPTCPSLVADPFGGTGTTALTASMLGRNAVTVDLGADYCRAAQWRIHDPAERARALGVPKPPPVPEGQGSLFDHLEAS